MTVGPHIALSKFHGLGNDFLVHVDDGVNDDFAGIDAARFARRVCDRHRGIGADGLLLARKGVNETSWAMVLFNADGSRAQMSGNGIRCLAHAITRVNAMALPVALDIATDGGTRRVTVLGDAGDATGRDDMIAAVVDMGTPQPGPSIPGHGLPQHRKVHRSATVDLGNPHIVLEVDDPDNVDLALEGPEWERQFADGINVHFVHAPTRNHIDLAVWERGAGITQACGTGATAAAIAAASWGIVDSPVAVAMPGGTVTVSLAKRPLLEGPSVWIADCTVLP